MPDFGSFLGELKITTFASPGGKRYIWANVYFKSRQASLASEDELSSNFNIKNNPAYRKKLLFGFNINPDLT